MASVNEGVDKIVKSRRRGHVTWGVALLVALLTMGGFGLGLPTASAAVSALRLTAGMPARLVPAGGIFLEADLVVDQVAAGRSTVLTGSADGGAGLLVDDAVEVSVRHEDGSAQSRLFRFNPVCAIENEPSNVDLSSMLKAGKNLVHLAFKDHCGGGVSTSAAFVRGDANYSLTSVAQPASMKVADAVAPRPVSAGDVFLTVGFKAEVPAVAGWGVLTGSGDGLTPLLVDDMIAVRVTRPDGSTVTRENRFNPVCAVANEASNIDLTALLAPGINTVSLTLSDVCGGGASSTPIFFRGPGIGGGSVSDSETCADELTSGVPPLDPVACYAPEVHLHPSENTYPDSPREFIAKSRLMWAADKDCAHRLISKSIDTELLGSGGYRHRQVSNGLCRNPSKGTRYASNLLTRPRDSSKARPARLAGGEGFYLNFPDDTKFRVGDKVRNKRVSSPLFYELGCAAAQPKCSRSSRPGSIRFITYWFFYNYNSHPLDKHEGDWEHVRVWLTSNGTIKRLSFGQHGCGDKTYTVGAAGSPLKSTGSHPHVYASLNGHASYPGPKLVKKPLCSPGQGVGDSTKAGGAIWRTWEHLAADMSTEDWYRYGGAWGRVGKYAHTTGPLGPGWKTQP